DESIKTPYDAVPATGNIFGKGNHYRVRIPAPWIRALDPDHNSNAVVVPAAAGTLGESGERRGSSLYDGEFSLRLPKVFDWLHNTFFTNNTTWEKRFAMTRDVEWAPFRLPYA